MSYMSDIGCARLYIGCYLLYIVGLVLYWFAICCTQVVIGLMLAVVGFT